MRMTDFQCDSSHSSAPFTFNKGYLTNPPHCKIKVAPVFNPVTSSHLLLFPIPVFTPKVNSGKLIKFPQSFIFYLMSVFSVEENSLFLC